MPREDARTKARRMLGEARVTIRRLEPDVIVASVRGNSAREYLVSWDPAGWASPCDALTTGSHIIAVQLIVLEPSELPDVGKFSPSAEPRIH